MLKDNHSISLLQWLIGQPFDQRQLGLVVMPKTTQIYALYVDETETLGFAGLMQKANATQLKLSSIPKGMTPIGYLSFNEQGFRKYCQDYSDYWQWVMDRNEARYQSTINHGKQYDAKNMMHTIRLLQMAYDIAISEKVIVKRPNRDELLAIKSGDNNYDELLAQADDLTNQIETAFANSRLPDEPNHSLALQALRRCREQLYS